MKSPLGIITVGESPRHDVVPGMAALMGGDVEIMERGALDGLTPNQVKALAPQNEQTVLCTRMADGSQVVLGKENILPLVQERIHELNRLGVKIVLLLCTGHFPQFEAQGLLLYAQKIVDNALAALVRPGMTLGVVVPLEEQMEGACQNLIQLPCQVKAAKASPYGDAVSFNSAAEKLKAMEADLVVLHCMGFKPKHKRTINQLVGKPTILANALVARVVGELLDD